MNERIKELIAQAREPLHNKDLPFNQGLMEYSEKFAELIVQECLDECWYDATPKQISDNIKLKFGVEE